MATNNPKRNRKTTRLQNWDYGWSGVYFITICTKNRVHYFGEIENEKMILSPVGIIADVLWYEIKNHAKNVELGSFVVIPNHVHGVITITDDGANVGTGHAGNVGTGHAANVGTGHALSLQQPSDPPPSIPPETTTPGETRFQNPGKNTISSMVGGYKSAVSKHAHRLGFELKWQVRFYDNIIHDDAGLQRVTKYIENNVKNWKDDTFFNE